MVNTNNLLRGLQRTDGTCATNGTTTLTAGGNCTLVITVNKDYESKINDYGFTSTNAAASNLTLYPTASWSVGATGSSGTVNQLYTQPSVFKAQLARSASL